MEDAASADCNLAQHPDNRAAAAEDAGQVAVKDKVKQKQRKGGEGADSWFRLYGRAGQTLLLDEHAQNS